jgi:hypothetical protein
MRPFGGRHQRVAGLIRKRDIAGDGATVLVAPAIMRLTPFVKASRPTIRQGNPHLLFPFICRAQRYIWGLFLRFADKNYGSILSIKSRSVFPQLCAFPYTYEIGEALSAGGRGTNPSAVGSHAGRFSCSGHAGRFLGSGRRLPEPRFANFTLPR